MNFCKLSLVFLNKFTNQLSGLGNFSRKDTKFKEDVEQLLILDKISFNKE